ncbi:MAG: type II secretion system protein [Planctomycetes bacterium]|nr:type II secretion system protein [Planctomycetota bacterium]
MNAKGFTLVELLVVIALITILASFLLPALQKAVESARSVVCANKLKQIGAAFMTYSADYGAYLPPVNWVYSGKVSKAYGMWNCLGPYTNMPQWAGWQDPPTTNDDPVHIKYDSYWGKYKHAYGLKDTVWSCPNNRWDSIPWRRSYAESRYLTSDWVNPRKLMQVNSPSKAIHVADSAYDWWLRTPSEVRNSVPGSTPGLDPYHHGGGTGTNLLFADSHVTYYTSERIITGITNSFTME